MREFYLRPYKLLMKIDSFIMTAYNAEMVYHPVLFGWLGCKETYGLKGYVTGDCGAISDIYQGHNYLNDGGSYGSH